MFRRSFSTPKTSRQRSGQQRTPRRSRLFLESLEERVVLDVGDTLATALDTGFGPGGGLSFQGPERLGDGMFGDRDVDMYRFQAPMNGVLVAQTLQPPGGVSMDTIIRLFNSAGTQLAFNDDCAGTFYSCLTHNFAAAGTYYVGISGFANFTYNPNVGGSGVGGDTGDYRLDLRLREGPMLERITPDRSRTPVSAATVRFDRSINPATFTAADINAFESPTGASIAVTNVAVVPNTMNREFVVSFPMQTTAGFYGMDIGPNIFDLDGHALDQNENFVPGEIDDRYLATLGIGGPQAVSISPNDYSYTSFDRIWINFDRAMNPASFLPEFVTVTGPSGAINVTSVMPTDATNRNFVALLEAAQTAQANYSVEIFPGMTDTWGNYLDQNGNYMPGEMPGDVLRWTFYNLPTGCVGREGFGYHGCASEWENINLQLGGAGVFVIISGGDDVAAPVNLGANTFNYYGTTYTGNNQVFVSSNGLITFGAPNSSFTNTDLTTFPGERAIAVLWDDWITSASDTDMVLGRFDGNRLIIEWNEVNSFAGGSSTVTFQAILQLNTGATPGVVRANYIDLIAGLASVDNGASATVGIKDSGTQGARRMAVVVNQAILSDFFQLSFAVLTSGPSSPGDNGASLVLGTRREPLDEVLTLPAKPLEKRSLEQVFALDQDFLVGGTAADDLVPTRAGKADAVDSLFDLTLTGF